MPAPAIWSARRSLSGSVKTVCTPLVTGVVAVMSSGSIPARCAIAFSPGSVVASVATSTARVWIVS